LHTRTQSAIGLYSCTNQQGKRQSSLGLQWLIWRKAGRQSDLNFVPSRRTLPGSLRLSLSGARAVSSYGLSACSVVPPGLSPKAALRRRTLWLAKCCVMAVVFPLDPTTGTWGAGSRLAYRACLEQLKPVFVVCPEAPREADCYRVVRSCLYGVEGYWVVPHPIGDGGPCDDE